MFCAISGVPPEDPVVSKKTGHLYERRLIEKHIAATGTCPITKDPLDKDDLIALQGPKSVKPRPITATSIPGLLSLFQNEWDTQMLEIFTLKQHMETLRQELAHALYQHDAACRVIARLTRDRDQARSALATAQAQLAYIPATQPTPALAPAPSDLMEVEAPKAKAGIDQEIIKKMKSTASGLSKTRKRRQPPATLATPEQIERFSQLSSNPIHKSTTPGILSLDLNPRDKNQVCTGGMDTNVMVFSREGTGKVLSTLSGHSKRVNGVLYHTTDDTIFSVSSDRTARIWTSTDGVYKCAHTFKEHSDEVTGVTLHATNDYIVTGSLDRTWVFYDIRSMQALAQIQDPAIQKGYTAVQFHPDGLILGTGSMDNMIRIWDVGTQANVATFEGHQGPVTALAFSENGYYMATAAEDATVKLWDLRKAGQSDQCNFKTIPLDTGVNAQTVQFDYSGQYLALGTSAGEIRIIGVKTWNTIKSLTDHTAAVTSLNFGADAQFLGSASMDRTLRFFGTSS